VNGKADADIELGIGSKLQYYQRDCDVFIFINMIFNNLTGFFLDVLANVGTGNFSRDQRTLSRTGCPHASTVL